MGSTIEGSLTTAGYQMLGENKTIEKLILDILESGSIRYLKAIPFLIYKYNIDSRRIYKSDKDKTMLFSMMMDITKKLFQEFGIEKEIPEHIHLEKKELEKLMKKRLINYNDFKEEFELQLKNEKKSELLLDKQKIYAERDLQMDLSRLFTKKEKQIIKRLLEDKPISKTDYEYYSRKTKKKLNSIIGLEDFAKTIYDKTPKYDEDLYLLKKKLEEWLEKEKKGEKISLIKFIFWDNKISLSYITEKSTNQTLNLIIDLNKIKDKTVFDLIKRYGKHNFR